MFLLTPNIILALNTIYRCSSTQSFSLLKYDLRIASGLGLVTNRTIHEQFGSSIVRFVSKRAELKPKKNVRLLNKLNSNYVVFGSLARKQFEYKTISNKNMLRYRMTYEVYSQYICQCSYSLDDILVLCLS